VSVAPPPERASMSLVSVVMAFHNGAPYLRDAAATVLAQTHRDLELLLCDDASTDDSSAIAAALGEGDARVRVLRRAQRGGPAAARNLGFDAARGAWIAVIDADDLVHPARIAGLLEAAEDLRADIVADDLVRFGAERGTLLAEMNLAGPWRPDAAALLRAEAGRPSVPVGYLKPLIRRAALRDARYRADMSVGEDFDLLLRLVLSGARMAVLPQPWYLYRRHAGSISHRLAGRDIAGMLHAIEALFTEFPDQVGVIHAELQAWCGRLHRAARFAELVAQLKGGEVGRAARLLVRHPHVAGPLLRSALEHAGRRLPRVVRARPEESLVLTERVAKAPRVFTVPGPDAPWTSVRAAALADRTGSGQCVLRAEGRAGLNALGHVPGWRLAELVPPEDGWSEAELRWIAALPWPTRTVSPVAVTAAADVTARSWGARVSPRH
jgi:succinoglycan biosynthesis protein ExoO